MVELHLTKKDFRLEWFSGTGGGGQYRNKHANCCRIKHLATGLMATGQSHRERPANQREAFEALARKVISYYTVQEARSEKISEERIRTYHEPRNDVLDHASGHRQPYTTVVVDGELGEMIEARAQAVRQDV